MKKLTHIPIRNAGLVAQAACRIAKYAAAFSLFACLAEGCTENDFGIERPVISPVISTKDSEDGTTRKLDTPQEDSQQRPIADVVDGSKEEDGDVKVADSELPVDSTVTVEDVEVKDVVEELQDADIVDQLPETSLPDSLTETVDEKDSDSTLSPEADVVEPDLKDDEGSNLQDLPDIVVPQPFKEWAYKLPVTVTFTQLEEPLDNEVGFARLDTVKLSADGKVKPDCSDIRVQGPANEKLPYNIEACSSTDTIVWFQMGSLPKGSSKYYAFVLYGNPNAASEQKPKDVWKAYVDVWSLEKDPAKPVWPSFTGNHDLESKYQTSTVKNAGEGCRYGGCIYPGKGINEANGDFIFSEMTVSGWARLISGGKSGYSIIVGFAGDVYGGTIEHSWVLGIDKPNDKILKVWTSSGIYKAGEIDLGKWTHLAFSFKKGDLKIYKDGMQLAAYSGVNIDQLSWPGSGLKFGGVNNSGSVTKEVHGELDQFRLADVVRSPASIKLEATLSSQNGLETENK